MAYRRASRTTRSSRGGYSRSSYGRRSSGYGRAAPRSRSGTRARAAAPRQQVVRLVIEGAPASAVARPAMQPAKTPPNKGKAKL